MTERTYWNGEPCQARRVLVVVADFGRFETPWFRQYVGQERAAVEVTYAGATFYIDDEEGDGWAKVTSGGSPRAGHRSLDVARVIGERESDA